MLILFFFTYYALFHGLSSNKFSMALLSCFCRIQKKLWEWWLWSEEHAYIFPSRCFCCWFSYQPDNHIEKVPFVNFVFIAHKCSFWIFCVVTLSLIASIDTSICRQMQPSNILDLEPQAAFNYIVLLTLYLISMYIYDIY